MKKSLPFVFVCSLLFVLTSLAGQAKTLLVCIPPTPTITGMTTVCGSGEAMVSFTGVSTSLWYTASVGGVAFATVSGGVFTTATLTTNTNFWVSGFDGSCESERVNVALGVLTKPVKPILNATILPCGSGIAKIRITNTFENIWYASSVGGIALDTTGQSFETPTSITGATSFWVSGSDGKKGCVSDRVEMVVTPNRVPEQPIVSAVYNSIAVNYVGYDPNKIYYKYFVTIYSTTKDTIGKIDTYKYDFLDEKAIGGVFGALEFDSTHNNYYSYRQKTGGFTPVYDSLYLQPLDIYQDTKLSVFAYTLKNCKSKITELQINIPSTLTGIVQDKQVENSMNIYPNPSNGKFDIDSKSQIQSLVIYNAEGKKEEVANFLAKEITTQLKGLLLVQIKTREGVVSKFVLVE